MPEHAASDLHEVPAIVQHLPAQGDAVGHHELGTSTSKPIDVTIDEAYTANQVDQCRVG